MIQLPGKTYAYMVGSEGNVDYMIVARHNSIILGLKPFIEGMGPVTVVGVRFRSVADVSGEPGAIVVLPTAKSLTEAWPKLPFTKADQVRASFNIGSVLQVTLAPQTVPELAKAYTKSKIGDKMAGHTIDMLPTEMLVVPPEDIREWIKLQYECALGLVKAPVSEEPADAPAVDNVVTLKPKVAKKKS